MSTYLMQPKQSKQPQSNITQNIKYGSGPVFTHETIGPSHQMINSMGQPQYHNQALQTNPT
jgi:hypothetical protein